MLVGFQKKDCSMPLHHFRSIERRVRCDWVVYILLLLLSFVLSPSVFAQPVFYHGEVHGQWTLENSPYHIDGDVEVPLGEQLDVEAGVSIIMEGNLRFSIFGRLNAIGGDSQDLRINFLREDSSRWQGIYFAPGSHMRSYLQFCNVINPWIGIDCSASAPRIYDNYIVAENKGIELDNASPDIWNNVIKVGGVNSQQNPTGIIMINNSTPHIHENDFKINAGSGGVIIGINIQASRPTINDNWLDISSNGVIYGIYASSHVTKLDISHNIIRTRTPGEMSGIRLINSTGVRVFNNDIQLIGTSSGAIGMFVDQGCDVIVFNNIVVGNGSSIGIYTEQNSVDPSSGYNNFWNHGVNYVGGWENERSDISVDPMFVNANYLSSVREDYILRWDDYAEGGIQFKSPCIDTGMPDYRDHDDTVADMGAMYFHQYPTATPELEPLPRSSQLVTYPNPFNSTLTVRVNGNLDQNTGIVILDLNGRIVDRINNASTIWQPSGLSAGQYIVRASVDGTSYYAKVIYLP